MKRQKIFRFLLVLTMFAVVTGATAFFASCSQASGGGDDTPATSESYAIQTRDGIRYVKNSDWDACTLAYLSAKAASGNRMMARSAAPRAAADISGEDLENIVDTLNENSTDNQYFLSEEDIPVEEGPLCTVYFINEYDPYDAAGSDDDWLELDRCENIERSWVKGERYLWEMQARNLGAVLFIDKVPPKPIPDEDLRSDDEKYVLYIIYEDTGEIYFEKHYSECSMEEITAENCTTVKNHFEKFKNLFGSIYDRRGGFYMITGQYYTPPSAQ